MKTKIKHYRNSLRLFLIFIASVLLILKTPKYVAWIGGVSMVYSVLGFLVNAQVIKLGDK